MPCKEARPDPNDKIPYNQVTVMALVGAAVSLYKIIPF